MKVLVAIANYGTKNDRYLHMLLREYRSMSYELDVVVLTNEHKDLGEDVETRVGLPSADPRSLPFAHRSLFAERADEYDLFVYTEDDILIREAHIEAFLDTIGVLPPSDVAGLLRYELDDQRRWCYPDFHGHYHWDPASVIEVDGRIFARFTNDHSGCVLLTREQLRKALDSGGFLVEPHEGLYSMLETAATDVYTQCGLRRVICISDLASFSVHHLPDTYVGKMGIEQKYQDLQLQALAATITGEVPTSEFLPREHARYPFFAAKWYYDQPGSALLDLVPSSAKTVLSVGCGWGDLETKLLRSHRRVLAVPLDGIIGAVARSRSIETLSPDLDSALEQIAGRTFDCLLLVDVLQALSDPVNILCRARDHLSRDGVLIATVPNSRFFRLRSALTGRPSFPAGAEKENRSGRRQLTTWLESSGLEIRDIHYDQYPRFRLPARASLGLLNGLLGSSVMAVAGRCKRVESNQQSESAGAAQAQPRPSLARKVVDSPGWDRGRALEVV